MPRQFPTLTGYMWCTCVVPEDRVRLMHALASAAFEQAARLHVDTEVRCLTRDGKTVRCLASVGVYADAHVGKMHYILRLCPLTHRGLPMVVATVGTHAGAREVGGGNRGRQGGNRVGKTERGGGGGRGRGGGGAEPTRRPPAAPVRGSSRSHPPTLASPDPGTTSHGQAAPPKQLWPSTAPVLAGRPRPDTPSADDDMWVFVMQATSATSTTSSATTTRRRLPLQQPPPPPPPPPTGQPGHHSFTHPFR